MIPLPDDPKYAEKIMFQAKYREFLRLPLDVELYNSLFFAIAHREHGKQMRTGWPKSPTSLRDRVDENNNILIETRCSNFLKYNFHENHYEALRNLVHDIHMPSAFVNEALVPRPFDSQLEVIGVLDSGEDEDEEMVSTSEPEYGEDSET
jgi:hypothetical protein